MQLAFNCKNIKNGQNPKVEAQMEIDKAIKSKKRSIGKKTKNGKSRLEPLKEERRSSVDLQERRRRSSGRFGFPSVIVVI